MELNKFFQSKIFKGAIIGTSLLLLLLIAFKAGTMVGFRKADFSCRWSDNYHLNFGGPKQGFLAGFNDRDFIEASGTFGQIIKIDNQTIVVKSRNDIEKTILINEQTTIKRLEQTVASSDLKVDEHVVIIGEPNEQGQIIAKLVRVIPEPNQKFPMPTKRPWDI